jgi:DNA-binding XRE family transcriptional regulator
MTSPPDCTVPAAEPAAPPRRAPRKRRLLPKRRALTAWREKLGFSQAHVARLLEVSRARVCEIESGHGCSLRLAVKIEALTKGAVRAADLVRVAPAPKRRRAGGAP